MHLQSGAAAGLDKDFDAAKISNPSERPEPGYSSGWYHASTGHQRMNGLPLTAAVIETSLPLALTMPAAGTCRFDVAHC